MFCLFLSRDWSENLEISRRWRSEYACYCPAGAHAHPAVTRADILSAWHAPTHIIERLETLPRAALNFVARAVSQPAARPSKDPSCARQTEDSLRPGREDKTVSNPKREQTSLVPLRESET